jgi:hypothetical protein
MEERLIGLVEPRERILERVSVNGGVLRHLCVNGFQLGILLEARDRDVTAVVGSGRR